MAGERLKQFLSLGKDDLGVIGGGKRKPSGRIDVAVIQSLVRKGEVSDLVAGYGQLIVDECHHLSARSFEQVARRSKARFVLGLSATVARKDGHQPIIFMQCGPVRYRVDARTQAHRRGVEHRVQVRATEFQLPSQLQAQERVPMPELYAALAADEARNALIFDDVLGARGGQVSAGADGAIVAMQGKYGDLSEQLIKKMAAMPWQLFESQTLPVIPDDLKARINEKEYGSMKGRILTEVMKWNAQPSQSPTRKGKLGHETRASARGAGRCARAEYVDAVMATAVVPFSNEGPRPSLGTRSTHAGEFQFRGMPGSVLYAGKEEDRLET